jgi:choline-sulfatase
VRALPKSLSLPFVLAVLAAACADRAPAAPQKADNILVVTIDTLRADRIGIYGGKAETPHIDRLAREGAWAPQAVVHAPLTRPSHVSLFTGLYPAEHGIRDNIAPALSADVPLLAEILERESFSTAAFVASVVLERQSGLARGFSHYSDRFEPNADEKPGDAVASEAIAWLAGKSRFFAWVHLFDPHAPYAPPAPYAERYGDRLYDGEVAWSDELIGRIVGSLRDTGRLDRTLVIVTSDHGEGLGDHGEDVHGYFVYESTLRVPLVVRGPGVKAGTRLQGTPRTIDLFPTILELAGITSNVPASSGRSLASALAGGAAHDEPAFAESLVPLLHFGWSDLRAVRDGRWKYILAPRPELYDLDNDPGELRNLVDAQPARALALRAGLENRLRNERSTARTDDAAAGVPRELLERLGALGYVSPGAPAHTRSAGADPKDKLDEYKAITAAMMHGLVALRAGRPLEALEQFRGLERRGAEGYELHYYRGRAFAALRRWRDAAGEYQKAVDRLPGDASAWRGLGDSCVELRDWPRAARAYERVTTLAPRDPVAHIKLGEVYRDMSRWDDAAREMRQAVALDPAPAEYWNALGTAYGGGSRMQEAERAFAEAIMRDGSSALYFYNHGVALQMLGRLDEARVQLRRAHALGYRAK